MFSSVRDTSHFQTRESDERWVRTEQMLDEDEKKESLPTADHSSLHADRVDTHGVKVDFAPQQADDDKEDSLDLEFSATARAIHMRKMSGVEGDREDVVLTAVSDGVGSSVADWVNNSSLLWKEAREQIGESDVDEELQGGGQPTQRVDVQPSSVSAVESNVFGAGLPWHKRTVTGAGGDDQRRVSASSFCHNPIWVQLAGLSS